MKKELCINCSKPMKKVYIDYNGIKLEARQCSKCKQKIFTEDLTMKAIHELESKKLEKIYIKHPIKIGHSWGITFPKDITEVFNINNPSIKLKVKPNIQNNKIEIDLK